MLGHTTDSDVLVSDAEFHKEFVLRLQALVMNLRKDYPATEIRVGVVEDVSIEELHRCPACGDRTATII